ncbi:P-loop containing nucleoside triphosphate hydrolase protein [Lizonia empirigonia]|nr:P-loop containing nucleoside triphosphate hydrolase protein [Lizonia empirigonia]
MEADIINRQLHFPQPKTTLFTLFRYATTGDLIIVGASTICALAAGALIPLPPIIFGRLSSIFASISNDGSAEQRDKHLINEYSLYFVYIAIGALVTWFLSTAGFAYIGTKMTRHIKVKYMEAVLRQNMAVFDDMGAGQLVSQLGTDMNVIQDSITQKLSITMSALGTLLATYIVSFVLYWKLALMLIWAFFLGLGLLYMGNRIAVRYSKRSMEAQSTGTSLVEDALGSIRSTTALGIQKHVANAYDQCLKTAEWAGFTLKSLMGTMVAVTVGTGYFNVALAFWQGSHLLANGETTFMAVVAITLITKSAAFCVLGVGQNAEVFTSAVTAAQRAFRMIERSVPIDGAPEKGLTPSQVRGNIELQNIKHIYPTRPTVSVVRDLSLSFPHGKTTAVVGSSGSGKSSIAKLLMRFYEPVEGQILLDGVGIEELNLKWLRQQIRFVNQEPFLFDTTIQENIEYGLVGTALEDIPAGEKWERVQQAAIVSKAHDFITSFPQGYDTTAGTRGTKLSGGQKQRVAIARALIAEPKILILDEATSALDARTELAVQDALDVSRADRTTIIIAHRLSTIKKADNIIVLKDGSIVEQGPHQELMKKQGTYYDLVQSQQEKETKEEESIDEKMEILPAENSKEIPQLEDQVSEIALTVERDVSSFSLLSTMRFVLSLNAAEWHFVALGVIFSVVAALEEPASAILFGKAIVAISRPSSDNSQMLMDAAFWSWMFFVLAVVMTLAFAIQGSVFAYCSERLIRRARRQGLTQILRQPIAFFDEKGNSAAALATFLSTEAADLAGISGGTLGMLIIGIVTLITGLVVGLAFGWKLALVCSSVTPVLFVSGFIGAWAVARFEMVNEKTARVSSAYAGEAISAIETVAALTMESQVLARYQSALMTSMIQGLKANVRSSLVFGFARSGIFLCMALGFWYGGQLILSSEYSLFQFVVVYSSIITSAYSAGIIFSFTPDVGKAKRAAFGLQTLLTRESNIDPDSQSGQSPGNSCGQVNFADVSFAYPTRAESLVLRNLTLNIPAGSSIALVGHTGSGKSTIAALLERFYNPTSGAIFLDGQPITSLKLSEYRSRIGLVNQEPTMLGGTIRSNLLIGLDESRITEVSMYEACKKANILDFITSLPEGFDTQVGNRGSQLSGGQRQRLAIARALIRDPPILVFDEATSAVDSVSESLIQSAIREASRGRTTITIAHRMSTIKNVDVIYVLDRGEVIEHGSHGQLMARKGSYYQLFTTNLSLDEGA